MHLKKHISIFNFNYLLGFFLMLAFIILLNFKIVDSIISQTIRFFFTTNFFFNLILYFFIPIFVITIIVLILVITHYTKKGIRARDPVLRQKPRQPLADRGFVCPPPGRGAGDPVLDLLATDLGRQRRTPGARAPGGVLQA